MKKHLTFKLLPLLALTICLTSCLKDEPGTILYGSQIIPDINIFMPSKLLETMGNDRLHYGDEPPRISGVFCADSLYVTDTSFVNTSLSQHSVNMGHQSYDAYFRLYDQIKGILKCDYTSPRDLYNYRITEMSRTDTTFAKFDFTSEPLLNSPYKPAYFDSETIDLNNFNHAYLMGKDNAFTLYYYEVLINDFDPTVPFSVSNYNPIVANIISGKLAERQVIHYDSIHNPIDTVSEPYISDFFWGKEVLGYFKDGSALQQLVNLGYQPSPGDTWLLDNQGQPVGLVSTTDTEQSF